MNIVLQQTFNIQRASVTPGSQSTARPPDKILYLNTNFHKKLNNESYMKDCVALLRDFYAYDWVLMPFFFSTTGDRRALMVSIEVKNSGVELYDKERCDDDDTDSKSS